MTPFGRLAALSARAAIPDVASKGVFDRATHNRAPQQLRGGGAGRVLLGRAGSHLVGAYVDRVPDAVARMST